MANNEITLTAEQVDDLVAFVRAALDVADYGMKQTMMRANAKLGESGGITVTGDTFKHAASKALPHLGLSVKWADKPEKTRRKTR